MSEITYCVEWDVKPYSH